jgi:DNA repair ATPase RecN
MNNDLGFYITHLRVTGNNKKPAEIPFENGFNLISGVSDTGKSYIFSCLNYMLGKEDNPKSIPESVGYSNFYLGIKTFEGEEYTIYRKLFEKSAKIKKCSVSEYENSKLPVEEYFLDNKKTKNSIILFT